MPRVNGSIKSKKYIYYIFVAMAIAVIGYFNFPSSFANGDKSAAKINSLNEGQVEKKATESSLDNLPGDIKPPSEQEQATKPLNKETKISNDKNTVEQAKFRETSNTDAAGLLIQKSEVSAVAKFYPYQAGDLQMEVLAVKASDGSIRTALNTCQVCYDSGRGYYQQDGDYLICQNCKNRFHIDQVGLVKGGCNPVAVTDENKKDMGQAILISKGYLDSQSHYFSNWKG